MWGFLQSWAELYNIPFDFPAGGLAIGHSFLYVGASWTYDYWSSNPISGGPVTGRRLDIDAFGVLFTPDGTSDSIPGDGNPPDNEHGLRKDFVSLVLWKPRYRQNR
jgi:hypothetical protein